MGIPWEIFGNPMGMRIAMWLIMGIGMGMGMGIMQREWE